ncbi:uncharacterized protein A4U43_C05F790 [Asparagus officinalis]|uniref:Chromo domain-containing protein n=1 Tax=Asparagus officinalis TaxID=4686 RepID=A0A5P1ETW8_ASPOF|nr:uncharacterized protein A4U43_C05F790 [Asparagus officinalis]
MEEATTATAIPVLAQEAEVIIIDDRSPAREEGPRSIWTRPKRPSPKTREMAFFRNFGDAVDSDQNLNDKVEDNDIEGGYNSLGSNRQMDLNFVENGVEMKEEDQYHSGDANAVKGTGPSATWGSNFWKDCQPMSNRTDEEVIVVNSDEDSDGQKDGEQFKTRQVDVPADEMLSDDYYEQDGEEQSDSLISGGLKLPSISVSRLPPRQLPVAENAAAKSANAAKYDEYDGDEDYEETDEEEDDDPEDADFEPDFGESGNNTKNKAKMSDCDDFVEEDVDEDYDDLDLSDEEDLEFNDNNRERKRLKVGRKAKSIKDYKSSVHNRQKRGKTFSDEEESSEKDSEQDTDEEFSHKTRKALQVHKKGGAKSTGAMNINSRGGELRSSGRTVRKVSYVESEESEKEDEERSTKAQKLVQDDADENDIDTIERVLWYQPEGMAEDAIKNNKSAQPSVLSTIPGPEPEWDNVEFYIKWKGQSYLHCQWKSLSDLQNLTGFKKVLNYIKRVSDERKRKNALSREEAEVHDVSKEMELDLLKQYSQVERIFADRISKTSNDDIVPEYLVKWQGLSYAEATWEKDTDIAFAQYAIDEYKVKWSCSSICVQKL